MAENKFQWVVVTTDGDADYTSLYEAEHPVTYKPIETAEEAAELQATLPEDNDGMFFRVIPIEDANTLRALILEIEDPRY